MDVEYAAGTHDGGRIQRRFSFTQVIVFVVWANAALFAAYGVASKVIVAGSDSMR